MGNILESADVERFEAAAKGWLCDSYELEFRYVALLSGVENEARLLNGSVSFYPWVDRDQSPFNFEIEAGQLVIGQMSFSGSALLTSHTMFEAALAGEINIKGRKMSLPTAQVHVKLNPVTEWLTDLSVNVTALRTPTCLSDSGRRIAPSLGTVRRLSRSDPMARAARFSRP
jgi:hypothetical protein